MSSVEERLAALESAGWQLVDNTPARFEMRDGQRVRVSAGNIVLERYFRGNRIQESSQSSIEEALTRAELQQKRLADIESVENRVGVRTDAQEED